MSGLLLASRTPDSWAPSVAGDLAALLSDHAHCELKAAASAMTLLRRHGARAGLVARLTPLVREELEHFQRVLRELAARGEALQADRPSPYTRGLLAAAGEPRRRADGYLGALLVAALIEMRSHERFTRLLECRELSALHELFASLADAEERHGDVFLQLALQSCPEDLVRERFDELARAEARVLAEAPRGPRIHSGC
ncbi:MAG TPA: tRNA isopentenyl-2-thiomethyl-A-37 hydroxylase MiaE [Planctomycetota bacterium]|nr:tRNA isopentenyl-2-thiomethyl-A-37 hydroxylase MiaE [Planctomycetota bacterium]